MYLLVLLVTLGCALASPVDPQVDPRNNEQLAAEYVLPGTAIPSFYDVRLFLDPGNPTSFRGESSVRITAPAPITEIVLHAMNLDITSIIIESDANPGVNIYQSHTEADNDSHLLRITISQPLVANAPYTIHFVYNGEYATNMFGIYISTYQHGDRTVNLITSQLQPTFARRAFPCFDEPRYKAIFRTTIYAPQEYPVVRTNTNIRTNPEKPEVTGYVKHEFQDTLEMSTYLLAYLVSEFEYVTNEQDQNPLYRVPFRVYARPEVKETTQFALKFGQENMKALEEYTDFPYAFEKFDKVAVPDFAAGAMENWGLVIYREVALLVTEDVTTTSTLQNIGRIITHENMHMWFGNEVSPTSWTYTWLNEGFANFFENFATDFNADNWRMMDQYILILQNVMQSDAVLSVNPMTHPVFTPSQIIGTFNAVAYQKSGSVIRMMQHFLTPEVFRQGLIHYLMTNSRKAVEPPQLYASLQYALDSSQHSINIPIATIMERWTTQGGFPVLQINRTAPDADSVTVRQRRYLTDSSQTSTSQWHVPLNWVLSTDPNFENTSPQAWLVPSNIATAVDVPNLMNATWYLFNKQQTGYYRVNYEPENWAALAEAINENHEVFHILNRAQLLDDSFNLARTGYLDYRYPLDMSRYLEKEKDYIPWGAANPSFSYLDLALSGSPQHELFRRYLLNLTAPLYAELGFNVPDNEEHVTAFHRNIILDINCRHGNQDCVQNAQQLLQNFRDNGEKILADLQTVVYCSGLRGGDVENFNFLWQQYLDSSDSSQQSILLNALGCTSNAERRTFYLNQIVDTNSAVREQDRHTILVSVINASPENMNAALEFVIEEWPNIQPRVQGLSGTSNILTAFSRRLTTEAHRASINEFETRHGAIFSAAEIGLVAAIKENIDASIDWSDRNAPIVEAWLEESYGEQEEPSSAAALSASLLIFSSAIFAIFAAY